MAFYITYHESFEFYSKPQLSVFKIGYTKDYEKRLSDSCYNTCFIKKFHYLYLYIGKHAQEIETFVKNVIENRVSEMVYVPSLSQLILLVEKIIVKLPQHRHKILRQQEIAKKIGNTKRSNGTLSQNRTKPTIVRKKLISEEDLNIIKSEYSPKVVFNTFHKVQSSPYDNKGKCYVFCNGDKQRAGFHLLRCIVHSKDLNKKEVTKYQIGDAHHRKFIKSAGCKSKSHNNQVFTNDHRCIKWDNISTLNIGLLCNCKKLCVDGIKCDKLCIKGVPLPQQKTKNDFVFFNQIFGKSESADYVITVQTVLIYLEQLKSGDDLCFTFCPHCSDPHTDGFMENGELIEPHKRHQCSRCGKKWKVSNSNHKNHGQALVNPIFQNVNRLTKEQIEIYNNKHVFQEVYFQIIYNKNRCMIPQSYQMENQQYTDEPLYTQENQDGQSVLSINHKHFRNLQIAIWLCLPAVNEKSEIIDINHQLSLHVHLRIVNSAAKIIDGNFDRVDINMNAKKVKIDIHLAKKLFQNNQTVMWDTASATFMKTKMKNIQYRPNGTKSIDIDTNPRYTYMMWPTTQPILYKSKKKFASGVHIHKFDNAKNRKIIDETFDEINTPTGRITRHNLETQLDILNNL